jgi:hypothetical protein
MAIGDKAAAKGLAVYTGSQDRRRGFENDNQRGDELADEIDARVAGDARLRIQQADPGNVPDGTVWVSWA